MRFQRNHSEFFRLKLSFCSTSCAIWAAFGDILLILCTGLLPFTSSGAGFILSPSISQPPSLLILEAAALPNSAIEAMSIAGAALLELPLAAM